MKILIVSFDRNLTNQLKEALKDYEVVNVKNGEEALNLTTHHFDVVIYDAISGAISEEDINRMYEQKFKRSKFVILADDLFPINANNLNPHDKVIIPRETAIKEISRIIGKSGEEIFEQVQPPLPELEIERYAPMIDEFQKITEASLQYISKDLEGKKRIAIVSFDGTLIRSITSLLPENVEITPVKSFRGLDDVLRDKDLVVFDAISGLTAKKRLIELSKDPAISSKPFLILIDELFSVDITDIPLGEKHSISRSESPQNIVEKIVQILTSKETGPLSTKETIPMQIPEKITQEKTELGLFEDILESVIRFEPQEELSLEEQKTQVEEKSEIEEYTLPALNEQIEKKEAYVPPVSAEEIKQIIRQSVASIQPSAEEIRQIISQSLANIGPMDEIVRGAVKEVLESKLESILREEIKKAIEAVPLEQIIRKITYQALRERLRELIT